MSALSITPANVSVASGPVDGDQEIGEAAAAGAIVAKNTSDGKWYKAECDGTVSKAGADGIGMLLASADAAGARVSVARPGSVVNVGGGTAGVVYCIGRTAGSLVPNADMASTDKVTPAALGIGSNKLQLMHAYNAGAVLA